ncbi:uncharacterized protein LOC131640616 [Vicia villosa]|uniref:uncharacterized protein LOC131640616 n=1 Tax=Vicia villosa TaxID=3911 RepID=UPI00273A89FD|nr:uncharacterized protein LOC131640616 [Vicia villosa]
MDLDKMDKRCCLVVKVDYKKAYDGVNWDYLRTLLSIMGFGNLWCKWMEACIFNNSMSILVNGSITKDFSVERGLRHGDPLSPFLFVMAMQGLTTLMNKAVSQGDFQGFRVNEKGTIGILQFADDTIVLGNGSHENLWLKDGIILPFLSYNWFGNQSFKTAFSELFALVVNKSMSVAEMGYREESFWRWNFESIRDLSDVDNQILEQFIDQIFVNVPVVEGDDVFSWLHENYEVFLVNSCFKVFANKDFIQWISSNMKAMLTQLWKAKVPPNILMFGWRFILNRLPTRDNLLVRGIELAEKEKFCALCEGFSETRNHIFLECNFSLRIWYVVHSWLGCSLQVSVNDFVDFSNSFYKIKKKVVREVVHVIWFAVSWSLWLLRNAFIFKDKVMNFEECISSIKFSSWKWINSDRFSSTYCSSFYE